MDTDLETPLDKAKRLAGGPSGLAKKLNEADPKNPIKPQAISQWKEVPPKRCIAVEKVTGISRHVLRPDVYELASAEAQP